MCGLGKDGEMELKAGEGKESWCFLMSVSQTMSICGQIVEDGMWGLERKHLYIFVSLFWPSLVAQSVKNLPAKQETQVWSLVWDDPWRRDWLPIPVFLSGECCGQRSLVGYSPRGHKELDTTE